MEKMLLEDQILYSEVYQNMKNYEYRAVIGISRQRDQFRHVDGWKLTG